MSIFLNNIIQTLKKVFKLDAFTTNEYITYSTLNYTQKYVYDEQTVMLDHF